MSSRDDILTAIRENRPRPVALPELPVAEHPAGDLVELFKASLHACGGNVLEVAGYDAVAIALKTLHPDAPCVCSAVSEHVRGTLPLNETTTLGDLATVDVFVCEGSLGVAENGAIWLPESRIVHRAAPFLAQHLLVVLDTQNLVRDMHEAYQSIDIGEEAYGVFIAGPSKTADIEQAIVVGAHGPRSLTTVLI